MSLTDRLSAIKEWLAERERERALASFTCAHCDKNANCGRAPSADCLEKHEQVARGEDWRQRPTADLAGKFPYS